MPSKKARGKRLPGDDVSIALQVVLSLEGVTCVARV